jgi:dipeptidyl aminopeptidase/acylaminoacyl peptidase
VGQDSLKKHITEADYEKWGVLKVNAISANGKWSTYTMAYENAKDTLFVQQTTGKKRFLYPNGREGKFINDRTFAYLVKDTLHFVNLDNGKRFTTVAGVRRYEAVNKGKLVLNYNSDNLLEIRKSDGSRVACISDVTEYKTDDAGTMVIYRKESPGTYEIGCVEIGNAASKILIEGNTSYGRFSWQANGKSVVFGNENEICLYRFKDNRLFKLDVKSINAYERAMVAKGGFTNLTVSDDGEKVFFSIINLAIQPKGNTQNVEVWNGNDNCLFPTRQILESVDVPKLAVWFPDYGNCRVLSDNSRFNVCLTAGGDYTLLSDPYTYVLTSKYPKRVDYYIKNVRTGAEKLLLEQHSEEINQLSFSPVGNSILYYRNKNWWLYNPETDLKIEITKNANHSWDVDEEDDPANSGAYGVASWTADEKYVLLYDRYDIWKVALDGSTCVRITKGREKGIVYRISKLEFESVKFIGYENGLRKVLDLSRDIVLEVTNTSDWCSGYAVYNATNGTRFLAYEPKKYSGIKRSANGKYLFASETFSQPPQIEFYSSRNTEVLFKSNKHQEQYYYGHAKLVHYKNNSGEELKGALFYPVAYKVGEKYPMVVKVYEQLSGALNQYVKPTLANSTGFNISVFTANGYFVLLPDIKYVKGSTGISAYDCVTSAVKDVVASYNIDEKRIGLTGHSFGGYETDFIITKTNMFAAAVSGAGIGNTIGSYFSLNTNGGGAEDSMWRFESQQLRMGIPFYENKQAYLINSPLHNADYIRTPLLQWTGKNDVVVPYEQSVNLYLALRKLRVQTILLSYPDEGHSLSNRANQQDLSRRILQWFDYYLKDKTQIGWITVGTSTE